MLNDLKSNSARKIFLSSDRMDHIQSRRENFVYIYERISVIVVLCISFNTDKQNLERIMH